MQEVLRKLLIDGDHRRFDDYQIRQGLLTSETQLMGKQGMRPLAIGAAKLEIPQVSSENLVSQVWIATLESRLCNFKGAPDSIPITTVDSVVRPALETHQFESQACSVTTEP
jgi:hypothetical protein